MKVVSGLSGIVLVALAQSIPFAASAQSPNTASDETVELAGIFDVVGDVLDRADDVLDIQEQERIRAEEREDRERTAAERQQLIEIERIRQERLAEEQRAASERQRVELEERQAQQQSQPQQSSPSDIPGVIFDGNSPRSCQRSRIGSDIIEADCQRFSFVDQSDLNAYLFRFSFDDDLFTFIVSQAPISSSQRTRAYQSNVMLTSDGAEDIDGYCVIGAEDANDLSTIRTVTCEALNKGLSFSYFHD